MSSGPRRGVVFASRSSVDWVVGVLLANLALWLSTAVNNRLHGQQAGTLYANLSALPIIAPRYQKVVADIVRDSLKSFDFLLLLLFLISFYSFFVSPIISAEPFPHAPPITGSF